MWSMGKRLLASGAILAFIAGCTTPPSLVPPPASCLERCPTRTCLLGEEYEKLPTEDARAKAELKCDVVNNESRLYCIALHDKCATILEDREARRR